MPESLYLGIHHVSLLVDDLQRALDFYCAVLDMETADRPELVFDGAWLDVGGGQQIHLLVLPNPCAGARRPEHGGRDQHAAFRVADIDVLTDRLECAGIAYTRSRSGRQALFCRDPDGNALEFIGVG